MTDFNQLKNICLQNSSQSEAIIDQHLIYYAARKNRLDREFDQRMGRYRHIARKLPKSWVNMLKSQYIAHRIFRSNGLIHKYLNHSEIKEMDESSCDFLREQAQHPWRFAFSIITDKPAGDFYEMIDVFTEDTFLLYSPGISRSLEDQPGLVLWLNLIGFNGSCWQSFGSIGAYMSFDPDDIFFFATELNPDIEAEAELLADLEMNPMPYLMLVAGSNYPPVFNGKDRLVQNYCLYHAEQFYTDTLKKDFKIEYASGVYRLSLKGWAGPPHFSVAYYDEQEEILLLSSMTDRGYTALVKRLQAAVDWVSEHPDIRVSPTMLITAREILKRDIQLDPYQDKFTKPVSEENSELFEKMNQLIALALPAINTGQEPDLEALAKQVGLERETAKEIMGKVTDRLNELRKS